MSNNSKNEQKPAFPAKVNAMGYSDGLTKLEFMALMLYSNTDRFSAAEAVTKAKLLLKTVKDSENE